MVIGRRQRDNDKQIVRKREGERTKSTKTATTTKNSKKQNHRVQDEQVTSYKNNEQSEE